MLAGASIRVFCAAPGLVMVLAQVQQESQMLTGDANLTS
jgi:hypothetical protein